MLVAIDSNVVDLMELACSSSDHVDSMESRSDPTPFSGVVEHQQIEVFACYWILTMAPAWGSVAFTFSDLLYDEVGRAPRAPMLFRTVADLGIRELEPPEHRIPSADRRPDPGPICGLGIKPEDAEHVADAIGLSCDYMLTNDRRLRNKSAKLNDGWGLTIRRPSEFLVEAVRAGAPWPTNSPWPWETIATLN